MKCGVLRNETINDPNVPTVDRNVRDDVQPSSDSTDPGLVE